MPSKQIRLDEDLHELLKKHYEETGVRITEFVRRAVQDKMKKDGILPAEEPEEDKGQK